MFDEKTTKSLNDIVKLSKSNHNKINSITLYNLYSDILKGQPDIEIMEDMNNYIIDAGIEIVTDGVEIDETITDYSSYEIQPFDPSQISIENKPLTLLSLIERIENEEVNLNTDFQRKAGLWTEIQKSQLIESLLLKIPLPAFYFDAGNDDNWLIIDGLQRITAIKEFVVDQTLSLTGLEFFTDLNGKKYDDLPRNFVRRIKEADYLKMLSSISEFTLATSGSIRTERMLDREFVLRYVAVCYFGVEHYQGIPDDFLNRTMEYLNSISPDMLSHIKTAFMQTMKYSRLIIGRHAFRKIADDDRRRPINKAIYEMWCYALNELSKPELEALTKKRNNILRDFMDLCYDDSFLQLIKSSDRSSYLKRIRSVETLLRRYI